MTAMTANDWIDRTHIGDCRGLLRRMADDRVLVQTCVTSPPYYRLRSYLPEDDPDKSLEIGRETAPSDYIAALVEVFRLVRNVLAADGTLWIVIGDTYAARRSWQAAGSRSGRKHATAQANAGGMQIDPGLKPKDLIGIPWLLAFALRQDGWYLRQGIVWAKPAPMPESVTDRCARSHEFVFLMSRQSRYYFDHKAIMEPALDQRGPGNIRPVRAPPGDRLRADLHLIGKHLRRHKRDVWTVATKPFAGAHFATFPDKLIEPCILAASRTGDIVLDPFMGSGTTGRTAARLQRKFIGCELNPSFPALEHPHR